MAEVLGVVASGIAVTQLATQVTSSIIKLKNYWGQIKDVPSEISFLLREIDALNVILCHIQDDLGTVSDPALGGSSIYLDQSLELCGQGSAELTILVNELAAKIEGKRGLRKKLGSAKVVLKDEEVKRLKRRMKSAIRLLSLSYQCHSSVMIRLHSESAFARLSNQITLIATNVTSNVFLHDSTINEPSSRSKEFSKGLYNDLDYGPLWIDFLFGRFEYHKRKRQYKGKEEGELQARFKLPLWFSQRTWEAFALSTRSGWRFALQTYRLVGSNSPLFDAVQTNDISQVRQLLQNGEAFVTDKLNKDVVAKGFGIWHQFSSGSTALHCAAKVGNLEMCRLLLLQGADLLAFDARNNTPLHSLKRSASVATFQDTKYAKGDVMGTLRLLLKSGAGELLIDDPNILENTFAPIALVRFVQEEMYPPFSMFPLQIRLNILATLAIPVWHNVPIILQSSLVTSSGIAPETLRWTNSQGQSFLTLFARNFAASAFRSLSGEVFDEDLDLEDIRQLRASNSNRALWDELIRKFISAGAPLQPIDDFGCTPFWVLLWTSILVPHTKTHTVVKMWLEDLLTCGVDLQTYGMAEYSIMKSNGIWYCPEYIWGQFRPGDEEADKDSIILLDLSYGPLPEDWKVSFTETTEHWAGQFWEMVESESDPNYELLEIKIPGSWNDDT